jgi:phosphatidylglycerophosphatase A
MTKPERPSLTPPSVWRNPWHFIAFGFGSGAIQPAPGTWGTLVGLLFVPLLQLLSVWAYAAVIIAGALFGIWLCGKVSRDLGVHDHGGIVWDEIVGIWISLFLLPADWVWWLAGFVLFRILDIAKPWPIRWADRQVHGGLGIMLDDLMAGVLACAILHGARLLLA